MARQSIDCRDFGGNCTVMISADTKEELLAAAMEHAVKTHGEHDTPEYRQQVLGAMKELASA
jgi:predicted small metal-binding protein